MKITFEITDYDDSLIKGNFESYFSEDITLTFKDKKNSITLNSSIQKIFLYGFLEDLYKNWDSNSSFNISTFGNSYEYFFDLKDPQVKITGKDLLKGKNQQCIFYKKDFKNAIENFFENYFMKTRERYNEISQSNEFHEFIELFKKFKKLKNI